MSMFDRHSIEHPNTTVNSTRHNKCSGDVLVPTVSGRVVCWKEGRGEGGIDREGKRGREERERDKKSGRGKTELYGESHTCWYQSPPY